MGEEGWERREGREGKERREGRGGREEEGGERREGRGGKGKVYSYSFMLGPHYQLSVYIVRT